MHGRTVSEAARICSLGVPFETAGGGGYGDPLTRPPQAVCEDVRLGRYTPDQARDLFGVALTGTPVENGLGDLWAILDFTNPGLVGTRPAFLAQMAGDGEAALRTLNGILLFRNQDITRSQHIEFSRRFGELDRHAALPRDRHPDYPELLMVTNEPKPDGSPSDTKYTGRQWHSDTQHRPAHHQGSALHGRLRHGSFLRRIPRRAADRPLSDELWFRVQSDRQQEPGTRHRPARRHPDRRRSPARRGLPHEPRRQMAPGWHRPLPPATARLF